MLNNNNIPQLSVFLVLIFLFGGNQLAYGQTKEFPISLGIGGAYSYIPSFENSRILGYTVGIYGEYSLASKLKVFSGVVYNRKGGESGEPFPQENVIFHYQYDQFSVPVLLRYDVFPRVGIQVGLYGGYRMQGQLDYKVAYGDIARTKVAEDPNYTTVDEFHNFEFGSKFGFRVKLAGTWFVELNVAHAWTPLYNQNSRYHFLLIRDNDYLDYIDQTLRNNLDNAILDGKNVFISLELKKTLFSF